MNIGFSVTYSHQFLAVPKAAFNILQVSLVAPWGRKFIHELQAHDRQVYSWTVNDEKNMDWCIRREMDGIVTDDIPKLLEMCKTFKKEKKYSWLGSVKLLLGFAYFNIWLLLFGTAFNRHYGRCIDRSVELSKRK